MLGGELRSEGEWIGARERRKNAGINGLIHALLRFGKNRGGAHHLFEQMPKPKSN